MALVVRLQITNGGGGLDDIELLEVRRLTRLHSTTASGKAQEVHEYAATRFGMAGDVRATAQFSHRYGDGAWVCVLKALEALRDSALPDDIETTQPGGQ